MKRGVFFSMDALVALLIIFFVLLIAFFSREAVRVETEVHQDILNNLANLKVGDVGSVYVQSLISSGKVTNPNNSLLQQIGEFYVTDVTEARLLAEDVLSGLNFTENIGIWYGSTLVFAKNATPYENSSNVDTARKILSGISGDNGSVTGFSARAFLSNSLLNKYAYFGGYVGDGNITLNVSYTGDISSALLEIAITKNFELYVNGVSIGSYSASASETTPANYSIPVGNFISGDNIVEIKGDFLSVAGGFLKITYSPEVEFALSKTYKFPGIEGGINLYDGFYVPGDLESLDIFLHLNSTTHNAFLNIGNVTVFNRTTADEEQITISNSTLSGLLDYGELSSATVPLRLGLENVSFVNLYDSVDVFSVTDLSGSMSGQPLSDAKAANILLIDFILNYSGNRVGLVGYETLARDTDYHSLSNNSISLKNVVNNVWNANGWTCICCGINKAVSGFVNVSNASGSLVGYWRFDESSGATTAVDSSGNGNDGTLYGNTVFSSNGKFGNGLFSNGTASGNVTVLDDNTLDFGSNEHFTISFWHKNSDKGNFHVFLTKIFNGPGNQVYGYTMFYDDGDFRPRFRIREGTSGTDVAGTIDTFDGQWHHVAAGRNSSHAFLYIDGNLNKVTADTTLADIRNSAPLGIMSDGWNGPFNGTMDDLRIYNRALSVGEIQALASQTPSCGNSLIEGGEVCDGNQLACFSGGGVGVQNCNSQCDGYNSCTDIKQKFNSMVVMSDGAANVQCAQQGTGNAAQDAIQAACDAYNNYGIIVNAVGYGTGVNEPTMQSIASCGNGYYYYADIGGLTQLYGQIVQDIIARFNQQTLEIYGNLYTRLYSDSFIRFVFNETIRPFGLIVSLEKGFSTDSSGSFFVPDGAEVVSTEVSSYSGPRWTNFVSINESQVFNLSVYGSKYLSLGDPYIVNVPSPLVAEGLNVVNVTTGLSPQNSTAGSIYNKIIYTIVKNATSFSPIVASANGCDWSIQFEDDTWVNVTIPSSYAGTDKCSYDEITLGSVANDNDALQIAVLNLLSSLDVDSDGKVDFLFTGQDLQVSVSQVTGIPFTWSTEVQARRWY